MRARNASVALAITIVASLALMSSAPAAGAAVKVVPVKTGLNSPSGFTFAPNGDIWYLERLTGEIRILDPATKRDRLFYDITKVNGSGERGALGIALHPDWPTRHLVYVYVTRTDRGQLVNELMRIRVRDGEAVAFRVLFKWAVTSATNHNGGRILFGPDRKLWIVTGDNADAANSQEKRNLRGKVLRIDADGSIPSDNPFGTRIWSFGHRNSFGMAFDPETDRPWETENGPACMDEINLIRKGGNFAWGPQQSCDGPFPQSTNNSGPLPRLLPKRYFVSTIGITGMAFCRGCRLGMAVRGDLVFGDVNTGTIRAIDLNAKRTGFDAAPRILDVAPAGIHSMEVGPSGRIYISGATGIWKLVKA